MPSIGIGETDVVRGPGIKHQGCGGERGQAHASHPTHAASIGTGASCWTTGFRTGGAAPQRDGLGPRGTTQRPSPEDPVADRPPDPALDHDFARDNGWDADYETYSDFDLPTYVGPTTFMNLPWITDPAELARLGVDVAIVGAPFDDAVSHRPGARFGPRAIREAQYTTGSIHSLQLGIEPFEHLTVVDAGDA